MSGTRSLAAILAADAVGFRCLVAEDAAATLARLEPLAKPHGIIISARIREDAQGRLDLASDDLGYGTPGQLRWQNPGGGYCSPKATFNTNRPGI
jgi:hypothetical protein